MKNDKLSHVDPAGNPTMVDVSGKDVSVRKAKAQAVVVVGREIVAQIGKNELYTGKGPVFQTAIIAGVMGGKKTADLIPFCHPLPVNTINICITHDTEKVFIEAEAKTEAKTGVEMEALTAASIAALTIYDMCKALSHDIRIEGIMLMEKTGGKKDFKRE